MIHSLDQPPLTYTLSLYSLYISREQLYLKNISVKSYSESQTYRELGTITFHCLNSGNHQYHAYHPSNVHTHQFPLELYFEKRMTQHSKTYPNSSKWYDNYRIWVQNYKQTAAKNESGHSNMNAACDVDVTPLQYPTISSDLLLPQEEDMIYR